MRILDTRKKEAEVERWFRAKLQNIPLRRFSRRNDGDILLGTFCIPLQMPALWRKFARAHEVGHHLLRAKAGDCQLQRDEARAGFRVSRSSNDF